MFAIIGGVIFGFVLMLIAGFVYYMRKNKHEQLKLKLELEHSYTKTDQRYTDLPRM